MKIPARPPAFRLEHLEGPVFAHAVARATEAQDPYWPWERFRFHAPPDGLTAEQWWIATSLVRRSQSRSLPLNDMTGRPFTVALPDEVLRLADRVSLRAGGSIGMAEPVTDPATRDTYIVRSLMEESITSSQLEGAVTTRKVAKDMLRSGRPPRDEGEQMIWNNYQAMQFVHDHRKSRLTPALVRELHGIVTFRTLADPVDAGRLQEPSDERVHVGTFEGEIIHTPPPAEQLPARLTALCDFASSEGEGGPWLHPVLRAIVVHFMVGYDHYFVDGNGRLARALFYWCMLRQGLWLTEFVTISAILKRSPTKYAHAYLNSEYEGDVTYFVLHQLQVLDEAFSNLENYLASKMRERREMTELLSERHREFNHRQLALLESAVSDPAAEYTAASHANSHHVTVETARQDLLDLEQRGFLRRSKQGRVHVWHPVGNFRTALRD